MHQENDAMSDPKDKIIADLAFNLGAYIFQFSNQNKAQADELIDMAMDDIDGMEGMNGFGMRVRAQIVRGFQSAGEFALSQATQPVGLLPRLSGTKDWRLD
jgi:hypothetical protein